MLKSSEHQSFSVNQLSACADFFVSNHKLMHSFLRMACCCTYLQLGTPYDRTSSLDTFFLSRRDVCRYFFCFALCVTDILMCIKWGTVSVLLLLLSVNARTFDNEEPNIEKSAIKASSLKACGF